MILLLEYLADFQIFKYSVTSLIISVFDWVENIVGKGEKAGYLFPKCFQKALQGSLKVGIVW